MDGEARAEKEYRQQYVRQEYRSRNAEHLREMSNEIEDEDSHYARNSPINHIRAVFRPNPELNHLLDGFIAKMDSRLDEE